MDYESQYGMEDGLRARERRFQEWFYDHEWELIFDYCDEKEIEDEFKHDDAFKEWAWNKFIANDKGAEI